VSPNQKTTLATATDVLLLLAVPQALPVPAQAAHFRPLQIGCSQELDFVGDP
jgi:hypothetical protein